MGTYEGALMQCACCSLKQRSLGHSHMQKRDHVRSFFKPRTSLRRANTLISDFGSTEWEGKTTLHLRHCVMAAFENETQLYSSAKSSVSRERGRLETVIKLALRTCPALTQEIPFNPHNCRGRSGFPSTGLSLQRLSVHLLFQ